MGIFPPPLLLHSRLLNDAFHGVFQHNSRLLSLLHQLRKPLLHDLPAVVRLPDVMRSFIHDLPRHQVACNLQRTWIPDEMTTSGVSVAWMVRAEATSDLVRESATRFSCSCALMNRPPCFGKSLSEVVGRHASAVRRWRVVRPGVTGAVPVARVFACFEQNGGDSSTVDLWLANAGEVDLVLVAVDVVAIAIHLQGRIASA
ncbi:hypothetical protein KC349_g59 [Hortaea werneckii]|nr:hypothetical protein KC349_g59 [Hortaea werneckii]